MFKVSGGRVLGERLAGALLGTVSVCVTALTGCGGANDPSTPETLGQLSEELVSSSEVPFPCDGQKKSLWGGNKAELLLADALARCEPSFPNVAMEESIEERSDYLVSESRSLVRKALTALNYTPPAIPEDEPWTYYTTFERWRQVRQKKALNCTSSGTTRAAWSAAAEAESSAWRQTAPFGGHHNGGYLPGAAGADATWGAYALCTAQVLRQRFPGSAGFDVLGLSPMEQLDLLGMVKERAQTAMLHNADLIHSLVVTPAANELLKSVDAVYNYTDTKVSQAATKRYLNAWITRYFTSGSSNTNYEVIPAADTVARWGTEISAATELHTIVTQEILDAMSRHRSAGVARPNAPAQPTPGEANWGPRSWSARALNFLVAQDKAIQQQRIGTWSAAAPERMYAPYVDDRVMSPQVWELFRVAQKLGTLQILLRGRGFNNGWKFEQGNTGWFNLFDSTEEKLREVSGVPTGSAGSWNWTERSSLLFTRYGITNAHATALIELISNVFGDAVRDATEPESETLRRQFALVPVGDVSIAFDPQGNNRIVFGDDFKLLPNMPMVGGWGIPTQVPDEMWPSSSRPGVPEGPGLADVADDYRNRSHLGAMSALARVRHRLLGARSQEPNWKKATALENADKTVALIDSSVGPVEVALRSFTVLQGSPAVSKIQLLADIRLPVGDPFQKAANVDYYVVPSDQAVPALVAGAQAGRRSSLFGHTLSRVLRHPRNCKVGRRDGLPEAETGFQHINCLTTLGELPAAYDVVLVAGQSATNLRAGNNTVAPEEIRLLASDLTVGTKSEAIISAGGVLGDWLSRFYAKTADDPAVPANDSFALPTDYVPPFNALALGAASSGPAAPYLLEKAKLAASNATTAVVTAYDKLQQEQADEATLEAATTKSQQLDAEAQSLTCGAGSSATCLPRLSEQFLKKAWFSALDDYVAPSGCAQTLADLKQASDAARENCAAFTTDTAPCNARVKTAWSSRKTLMAPALACTLDGAIQGVLSQRVAVHPEVVKQLDAKAATVPAFSEFAGGSIQGTLQAQFSAIRAAGEWLRALRTGVDSAVAAQNGSETALAIAIEEDKKELRDACDLSDVIAAQKAASGCPGADCGKIYSGDGTLETPYSRAWESLSEREQERRRDRCKAALASQTQANQNAIYFAFDNITGLVNRVSALPEYQGRIAASGATLQREAAATGHAMARNALEVTLAAESLKTNGIFRRFRAFDLWRARAQVEGARKLALVARRAVEARYVVDLGQLKAAEPLVASPASWSDVIYQSDLSLPLSVGGLAPPASSPGMVYPNQLVDYVGNLDSFVTGYFLNRPASPVLSDLDVASFRGPGATSATAGSVASWSASCATGSGEQWKALTGNATLVCVDWSACACTEGDAACAKTKGCIKRPTGLRGELMLDAWGRGVADIANAAMKRRFNARWNTFAVNFSGTGVVNCSLANDPVACRARSYVNYNLTHGGFISATNYDGETRRISAPIGQIEAAKAIFLGRSFDLLKDTFGAANVAFATRQEFLDRPMGGTYTIQIPVTPELQFEKIDLIQFLVGYSYWVKQGQ